MLRILGGKIYLTRQRLSTPKTSQVEALSLKDEVIIVKNKSKAKLDPLSLFVHNLPKEMRAAEIWSFFKNEGKVKDVILQEK